MNSIRHHFFILWRMTSEVIEGHIRAPFYLENHSFLDFFYYLILSNFMWMPTLWRHKSFKKWSLTSKVLECLRSKKTTFMNLVWWKFVSKWDLTSKVTFKYGEVSCHLFSDLLTILQPWPSFEVNFLVLL